MHSLSLALSFLPLLLARLVDDRSRGNFVCPCATTGELKDGRRRRRRRHRRRLRDFPTGRVRAALASGNERRILTSRLGNNEMKKVARERLPATYGADNAVNVAALSALAARFECHGGSVIPGSKMDPPRKRREDEPARCSMISREFSRKISISPPLFPAILAFAPRDKITRRRRIRPSRQVPQVSRDKCHCTTDNDICLSQIQFAATRPEVLSQRLEAT